MMWHLEIRTWLRVTPIAAACMVAAIGCKKENERAGGDTPASGDESGEPAAPESITVYSGRSEKLVGPVIAAFEKDSGIDVAVKYGDTAELAAALLDEGESSPADVFLAQDASTLAFLESKNVFEPLPDPVTERVPPTFRSKDGKWIGTTGRARVLAYSTSALKPEDLPASAAALTDPKWRGRVGWAPANASFQSAIAAMIQLEGEEKTRRWLEAMKANEPREYPKNTPAVLAVGRGEIDVALVNHYYLYRLRDEHGEDFPVENHYFRDGGAHSMVNLSGAAVIASSRKKAAAARLIEHMLSAGGQDLFVANNREFPVARDVPSPGGLPSIDTLEAPALDLASLRDLERTHELLRETGVLP
jgi:iron(III) transport system substrate-binding protein